MRRARCRCAAWLLAAVAGLLPAAACQRKKAVAPVVTVVPPAYREVPGVPLLLPRLSGWSVDPNVAVDPAAGGTVLRLVQHSAVAGAARIDVALTPPSPRPVLLEELLTHNLQEMAALEKGGALHINEVHQRRQDIGSCRVYQVRQQYTVKGGGTSVVIDQLSALLVLQGRGVVITAAGRSELYAPQRDSIERFFAGLRLGGAGQSVDLGRLGQPR